MGLIESLTGENRQRLEAIATKQRNLLNFKAFEPLPAKVLAKHFQATIFTAETVLNAESEQVKILCNSDDWSAGIQYCSDKHFYLLVEVWGFREIGM